MNSAGYFWVFVLPAGDAPNYFPNSFSGPTDNKKFVEHREPIHGDISRYNTADDDNFTQTGNFWRNVSVKIRSIYVEPTSRVYWVWDKKTTSHKPAFVSVKIRHMWGENRLL